MREILAEWVGKNVHLTTQIGAFGGGAPSQGKLVKVSDGGVLLQLEKGQTFFPATAILHIRLLDDQ